jgi:hypothetical protein
VLKLSRDNNPSGRITRPTRNTTIQTVGAMQPPINAPSMAVPARLRTVNWTGFPTNPHTTLEQINRITNYRGYKSLGFWRCQMASFPAPHTPLDPTLRWIRKLNLSYHRPQLSTMNPQGNRIIDSSCAGK